MAAAGHYSGKVHREGVNLQVITAEDGKLLWISPALPGGTDDITAARKQAIVSTCAQLDFEVLAGKGYVGAGGTVITRSSAAQRRNCPTSTKPRTRSTQHCALPSSGPSPGSSKGGSSGTPASARTVTSAAAAILPREQGVVPTQVNPARPRVRGCRMGGR
ncbi:transposase family protein [Streptomyces sp. NBC_01614]|uniref:transposase family protein n=1 Tax=Streptomyces sp. NBC_01614 TaxID=2975897 RepID=UPI00386C65BD